MSTHTIPTRAETMKKRNQLLRNPSEFYGRTRGWLARLVDRLLIAVS